jgi:hypothetical protein
MPYKDSAKQKENARKYRENNQEKIKKYRENNQEKIKEQQKEYRENNKKQNYEKQKEYREAKIHNVINSITSKCIIDRKKWDIWCDKIKKNSKNHPYSVEFTNDVMFDMMVHGCFYCGDIATTIDRLDSALDHTIDNCVGCCGPCNNSKGTADPSTFIRKSYYRTRGEYLDDVTDVWHENKTKPIMRGYKGRATKKGVSFELSKEQWNSMIVDECAYCHRRPSTWFGIDRVMPENGYVDGNVVTCCWDCNLDKHTHDVKTMMARNERIATRVNDGDLVIENLPKVILHKGIPKTSKKICANGKVYESQIEASRVLEKSDEYVRACIRDGRYSDDIFLISDEFYDFAISNNLENITKKMYVLFARM